MWKPSGADWLRAVATRDDRLLGEILTAVLPGIERRVTYWAHSQKEGTGATIDVEDIVAEACCEMLARKTEFRSDATPYTWGLKIAMSKAFNCVRRRVSLRQAADGILENKIDDSSDDPNVDMSDETDTTRQDTNTANKVKLAALIAQLPNQRRLDLIEKLKDDGLTDAEKARNRGKSVEAFKTSVSKARKQIRDNLRGEYVDGR